MANNYSKNPLFLDTVTSDLDIANLAFGSTSIPVSINKVRLYNATLGDKVILKDKDGSVIMELKCDATGKDVETTFTQDYSCAGLKLVAADNTLTTGNILIYVD
jgi:hypothetical protein